jgi:hypothetical protein
LGNSVHNSRTLAYLSGGINSLRRQLRLIVAEIVNSLDNMRSNTRVCSYPGGKNELFEDQWCLMPFISAYMAILVSMILTAALMWKLARRPGTEQLEAKLYLIPAGPWSYFELGALSAEGERNAYRALRLLRKLLGGARATLLEPSDAKLMQTYGILAEAKDFNTFTHKSGQRDYPSILLKLADSGNREKFEPVEGDSLAVLATRTGDTEHLRVILVFDPHKYPKLPSNRPVSVCTVRYHRIDNSIAEVRIV